MRIIFLGTPDFAVSTLESIVNAGFDVVAVVSAPDRPSGRGLILKPSAVSEAAARLGIPILKPEKLKDPSFLEALASYKADVQVVVAFRMLPELVWNMPPLGTFNLHASLLPNYRGAAPINHAIIQGETKTGVTTFKLIHAIDEGSIALQQEVEISENMTAGELHDELMNTGAHLMIETLKKLANQNLILVDQETSSENKMAPKLNPLFCTWRNDKTAKEQHNFVRGLSPFPGVSAHLVNEDTQIDLKIYRTALTTRMADKPGGTVVVEGAHIYVYTLDGILEILELQQAGKRRMKANEFLNGFKMTGSLRME